MPIKGLTDKPRFERIGKIRLGIKQVNANNVEYPAAVDYFACDDPGFRAVYGEKPKTIDICFPVNDPDIFASQYYRAYSRSRGLICKGDGATCNRLINAETGDTKLLYKEGEIKKTAWGELSCPGRECEYYLAKQCREIMFLQFFLPNVPGLGIWQLDTSSINSIRNINGQVELLRLALGDQIAFAPLKLSVHPMEVSPDGRKKTVYVLQLELPSIKMKLADLKPFEMLPSPEDEIPDELFPTEEQKQAQIEAERPMPPLSSGPIGAPQEPLLARILAVRGSMEAVDELARKRCKGDWSMLSPKQKEKLTNEAELDAQAGKEGE